MNIRAATKTTHLGRYHVVKRLAQGGMADVLLARTEGIAGFERHVVIKRIHAELLEEPRYVKMFLDEARLAASLHHHNIVQVNDIGEEDGEYFFAMEYVHGEDARTLLVDASQRGEQIPLEHVITIVTAAAAGLHHAHEQRGIDGTPLHIVHRDVSPANILVGYDGAVKVADFGIAFAAHRAEHTQSGVLKGKVAYMSPEQCNCEPVDRRSDVFSLGIVLYELVTVRPCFAGDNDFMTMKAIVGGKLVPPSEYRKDLPPALEAIIMKALARTPAERYQTTDELRIALEELAAAIGLRTSTTALADYMKTRFGDKALPWQEHDGVADEAEIEMVQTGGTAERVSRVPERQLAPSPNVQRRERAASPTVPIRPQGDDLAIAQAPSLEEDDLAVPVAGLDRPPSILDPVAPSGPVRAPTLPMRSLALRPPAKLVVGEPAEAPANARTSRRKSLWLVGAIAAVAIAGVSLLLVRGGGDEANPRASAARPPASTHAPAPQPLPRPTLRQEPAEPALQAASGEEALAPAPPPARKSRRSAHKDGKDGKDGKTGNDGKDDNDGRPQAGKKWDPDALFPR